MTYHSRTCKKCGNIKSISAFGKRVNSEDGYCDLCKDCERSRKAWKKYNQTYINKFPEKEKAKNAIKKMPRKTKGNELHHWSYNSEHYTDVIELNIKDHKLVHRKTIYDQEQMMYRNLNGILLDTREAAIHYYTAELRILIN